MANIFKKGEMVVSAGTVYADPYNKWVAGVSGGKVIQWNEELTITAEEKKKISEFVAEAESAPEDRF